MNEQEQRPAQPGALRRSIRVLTAIELTIGVISLLVIFASVLLQAGQRYLPIEGFAWTGELARFSLVWLTFSAAGILITSRGHIALEVVDSFKNLTIVRIVQAFALVMVAIIAGGLVYEAWALVTTQAILKSPVLRMPMSWVYIPVLIGAASTLIRSAVAVVDVALHGPVIAEAETLEGEVTA